MTLLKAGLAVAAILIGAIAAFLGGVLLLSALKTGAIQISYGTGAEALSETITLASDSARFWRLVAMLGVAPLGLGILAARWGWLRIRG